ncbi:MAG: hypothetical protein M3451_10270, partial [Chloroflexota bacterium]|nr:hypothetical protein [Chloroflexota bacterium]
PAHSCRQRVDRSRLPLSLPANLLPHPLRPAFQRRQTSLPDSPSPVKRSPIIIAMAGTASTRFFVPRFLAPFRFGVARKQRDRYPTPLYFSFQARIGSGVRNSMYPGDAT